MRRTCALTAAAALCCGALLSSCSPGQGRAEPIRLVEKGESAYTIVYPAGAAADLLSSAVYLRSSISKATGVTMNMTTDETAETDKEILIGATNRPASSDPASMGVNDYLIKTDGGKLVIEGGTDAYTTEAVRYFVEKYIPQEAESLSVAGNLEDRHVFDYEAAMTPAGVETVDGIPRLKVGGKVVAPVTLAVNSPWSLGGYSLDPLIRQANLAAQNGLPIVDIAVHYADGSFSDTKVKLKAIFDVLMKECPDSLFILRFVLDDKALLSLDSSTEGVVDQNGKRYDTYSIASDAWLKCALSNARMLVSVILSEPEWAKRVIGYHPCGGGTQEWYSPEYWSNAIDVSPVNTAKFRAYLREVYENDAALQAAWGDPQVTLDTAAVPTDIGLNDGTQNGEIFMVSPENRDCVDYLDYLGDLMSSHVAAVCETIKTASGGKSLTIAFYGYSMELYNPASSHFGLSKLLKSEGVDIIAGPVSYLDRNEGGVGAYMSMVGAITAAGKIWFDEGDYRSPVQTQTPIGADGDWAYIGDVEDLIQVAARQIGKSMVYNTGVWWFDLLDAGWFDHPDFWKAVGGYAQQYLSAIEDAEPVAYDVAVVLDEKGMSLAGHAPITGNELLGGIRQSFYRAGLSFQFYHLDDVLEGRLNGEKLLFFLDPWRLTAQECSALAGIVQKDGITSVWMGGAMDTPLEAFQTLTGMTYEVAEGALLNNRIRLEGENGAKINGSGTNRLYAVTSADATVLGRYLDAQGNDTAVAGVDRGTWKSVFYGGISHNVAAVRAIAAYAGVHTYLDTQDVVYANSRMVVVMATEAGTKTIRLPEARTVYDPLHDRRYENQSVLTVPMEANEVCWFLTE